MAISRDNFIKDNNIETSQGRDTFGMLSKQVQAEYDLAWKHQKPKKDEWEVRLRLYNNQKRDKKAVGDTTMFTIHQTVLASLYVDRLQATFMGREQGDEETGDNLTAMAKVDYEDMEKDIVDYEWDWDTSFFGRGLVNLEEYERDPDNKIYLPIPEVIDPIVFMRDPYCSSINGNRRGRGAARFYGYEVAMTRKDMEDSPHIFSDIKFEDIKFGSGTQSLLADARVARVEAQGNQSTEKQDKEAILGANAQYILTQWCTNWEVNGKIRKVKVWLANDRTKVVGIQVMKEGLWPMIDRALYPHSHDWDGTSIPDLTEDKQRARAVAQNLGLNAMKADLYPMYLYDSNKITNRKDAKFNFNKFIPIDNKMGEALQNSLQPVTKARPNMQLLNFIYDSLDASAQKATATPDIQQGIQSEKDRPLGETNLIKGNVDTRYSLSAKVFGWSEKRFWKQWYRLYKDNFEGDIDEKVLRIVGAFGAKWRPLRRDNIIANIDPDISIESQVVSRAKQLEERQALTGYFSLALQEPTSNRRWGLKKLGKLNGMEKDELDRLFPPTIDERIAEAQNEMLNKDKLVLVLSEDDHLVHLEIHAKANLTKAAEAHINAHELALSVKKTKPELFPEDATVNEFQTPAGTPQINVPNSTVRPVRPSQTTQ